MSCTRASDWYDTGADFLELCGDAQSQAKDEAQQEFAAQMLAKAEQYGLSTFISVKQMAWLWRIAGHEERARVEPKAPLVGKQTDAMREAERTEEERLRSAKNPREVKAGRVNERVEGANADFDDSLDDVPF